MANETGKGGFKDNPQNINRDGRKKKGKTLTDILVRHGRKRDVKDGAKNISRKEALAKKLWAMALSGDITAIRYIYDRIDGRPDQYHQVDMEHSASESFLDALKDAHAKRDNEPRR